MKEIVKSKFIADITENRLSKKEMSEKYELPQSEIGKLAKRFGVTFSKKRHATYVIVEDQEISTIPQSEIPSLPGVYAGDPVFEENTVQQDDIVLAVANQ